MAREFNPSLFGDQEIPEKTSASSDVGMSPTGVEALKKKLREHESEILRLRQRVDKLTLNLEQRNVQYQQALRSLESQSKAATQELARKLQSMVAKFTEQRVSDAKTQKLIDRHNSLVQNFETRMGNMQKVTSEQELKLMGYQSTLDEIIREIRQLKR